MKTRQSILFNQSGRFLLLVFLAIVSTGVWASSAASNQALKGSRFNQPIAPWTGQLIHLDINRRDPAGG